MHKKALNPSEYKDYMKRNHYSVSNVTDSYNYGGLLKAYKASTKDYSIIYYQLENNEQAVNFYENSQVNLELTKISNSKKTQVLSKNYSKYTSTSSDSYLVISRIDNTVIYASVNKKDKPKVDKVINKLGY